MDRVEFYKVTCIEPMTREWHVIHRILPEHLALFMVPYTLAGMDTWAETDLD